MTATPFLQLEADLSKHLPPELVRELLNTYKEIRERFYLGDYEPGELNAGKFCEVIYRILEFKTGGNFTPLGIQVKDIVGKLRAFENQTKLEYSLRIHVPRVAVSLYDVRNHRGVGHLSGDVNPNLADATLVSTGADWILAELVRLYFGCTLEEAQELANGLVHRRLPLVYAVMGKKRVLNPKLNYPQQVLLLLAGERQPVEDRVLFDWTGHSNFAVFRRDVLRQLHKKRKIEYSDSVCTILPPGLKEVEENYPQWEPS